MYEDCIETYEREAINKNTRICSLEEELEVANAKIQVLESQIEELDSSLSYEKSINASLMGTVTDLQSVLESTRSYAAGYDNVIAILREEADSYQAMLSATNEDVGSYEMKEKELVELLEKTKDSLDREKARAMDALEDKDTRIATLDKELAEKLNEMNMIRAVAKSTDEQLTTMTGRYDAERDRSDALEEKIRKLNLFRASAFDSGNNSEEGDRLSKLLKDVTASNDEYKVLVSSYENKTKLLSQQLLLSGQNVVNKQRQIENLQRQLVEATANAQTIVVDQEATSDEVSILRTKLDDAISSSTVWKAEANGMISQLTQDLKEKEVLVVELQNRLNNRLDNEVQPQETQLQSDSRSESLENQISQLKDALDESNQKAKERIMNKNQSLKEMQDSVTTLTAEIEDLRREKSQIMNRLNEEVRRREDDYKTREQYLRQKEDRHITEMKMIENDMSQTIRRLEIEIDTLKNKVEVSETSATTRAVIASKEQAKLLEESLRRSKEMEVSLINENMRMKRKIEEMEERKMTERLPVISVVMNDQDDEVNHDRDISVQKKSRQKKIPTYYKEKQRSGVINFVGNAWKKLFRR
jgi:chromosome segregation ATPase